MRHHTRSGLALWPAFLAQAAENGLTATNAQAPAELHYIMPEVAHSLADRWQIKTGWFTLKFWEDIAVDYTAFAEDADSMGYTRRIVPQYHWGTPELVACFSRVDLIDAPVQGGKFYKTYFGVNWWMSRQWKLGFGWGDTWLDRFGTTGITDIFLTRLQWVF